MSLINDALKKAQKLQSKPDPSSGTKPDSAPTAPIVPPPTPGGKQKGSPPVNMIWILFGGAGILLIAGIAALTTWMVTRPTAPPPTVAASGEPAAAPATPERVGEERSANERETTPSVYFPPPVAEEHIVPPPSPIPGITFPRISDIDDDERPVESSVDTSRPADSEPEAPAAQTEPMPEPRHPAFDSSIARAGPQAPAASIETSTDQVILDYIDSIRVAGIRAAGADSRVLMNDRVFSVGDVVERNLQLRLTRVEPTFLELEDPQGNVYTKRF